MPTKAPIAAPVVLSTTKPMAPPISAKRPMPAHSFLSMTFSSGGDRCKPLPLHVVVPGNRLLNPQVIQDSLVGFFRDLRRPAVLFAFPGEQQVRVHCVRSRRTCRIGSRKQGCERVRNETLIL